jgi:hypothetical protein
MLKRIVNFLKYDDLPNVPGWQRFLYCSKSLVIRFNVCPKGVAGRTQDGTIYSFMIDFVPLKFKGDKRLRKLLITFLAVTSLLVANAAFGQDILTLAEEATPASGDMMYMVAAPFTPGVNNKVQIGSIWTQHNAALTDLTSLAAINTVTASAYCQGGAASSMDCDILQQDIPGADHINALTEIAQGIKTAANDTDDLAVWSGALPGSNVCVEMNATGQLVTAGDTCANLGPGGTPTQIIQLNTSVEVTDTGTDGKITGSVDGVAALEINTDGTLIVGDGATADAVGILNVNTAIGFGASAACGLNGGCLAIGDGAATSVGAQAIAIGVDATASNNQAIAIGDGAVASGQDSIAIGDQTNVTVNEGIGIGTTNVLGVQGIAIGQNAAVGAGWTSGISIGNASDVLHRYSIAIGDSAQAGGRDGSIAIGFGAEVTGGVAADAAIAIGADANVASFESIALGNDATATSNGQFVVGDDGLR